LHSKQVDKVPEIFGSSTCAAPAVKSNVGDPPSFRQSVPVKKELFFDNARKLAQVWSDKPSV
jgi:hypothetical protein